MNIEKIKREILNSDGLDGHEKLDALTLIEEATRAIPIMEATETIRVLERIYQDITRDAYKDALLCVIKKYKSEIRRLSYESFEGTVTVKDFLESLGVPVKDIPTETLDLKLTVGEDDGMGYTPNGFQDVIDSYPDEEKGEFRLWI